MIPGLLRGAIAAFFGLATTILGAAELRAGTPKDVLVVGHVAELQTLDPEDLRWLVNFARSQGERRLGRLGDKAFRLRLAIWRAACPA